MSKIYINVPYSEKEEAKCYGAKWDPIMRSWYYSDKNDSYLFKKWAKHGSICAMTCKNAVKKFETGSYLYDFLSDEQKDFVDTVAEGKNVLVDACIGSGKTTSIQSVCARLKGKKILYLTYNTLLKVDAKDKIRYSNITVTNYHGYAFMMLKRAKCEELGISDLIQTFLRVCPDIPQYDLLLIDEYQDIDLELSQMLNYIKSKNPDMQIVAVGDMDQKILDKTTLNIKSFINDFLEDHISMTFTNCFRLNRNLANLIGKGWHKTINGTNEDCKVYTMNKKDVLNYLADKDPKDVLCLGARTGIMSKTLNKLETRFSEKYNKNTVWASIKDSESCVYPTPECAIFTTYDGSKGLERPICVVFDYTKSYFDIRNRYPDVDEKILKNLFLVAASRGKKEIIFVQDGNDGVLSPADFKNAGIHEKKFTPYDRPFCVSDMFDHKYKEDVEECYKMLKIKKIPVKNKEVINIKDHDGLIDLSPCIGSYVSAVYFKKYDINAIISRQLELKGFKLNKNSDIFYTSLEKQILELTALETNQFRYRNQVSVPFISRKDTERIIKRLKTVFSGDEYVEEECDYSHGYFMNNKYSSLHINGRCDVIKGKHIWELKFVSDLKHEHFLQLACYLAFMGKEEGILWNVKTNERYKVTVPKKIRNVFIRKVISTITKNRICA